LKETPIEQPKPFSRLYDPAKVKKPYKTMIFMHHLENSTTSKSEKKQTKPDIKK
jgi:hypothetical protein